ncbi:MAG TPA: transglycosylase domain-containing protein, partial [Acidobacteriota bacterium]|nr:transglycosylase domain-containing protein [Acidobacteriota bacterium]
MIPGLTRFSTGGMNATKVLEEIRLHRIQIPRLSPRQICVCLLWVFVVLILGLAVVYEIRTSALQAWLFSRYAAKLHYTIGPGPSPSIVFPSGGPFDRQRGYPQISNFQRRLEARGFQVAEQARFSPQLAWMAGLGVAPPYRERAATGVRIQGIGRGYLFNAASNDRLFHEFEEIPPLVVQSLLFIENRELGEKPPDPRTNPAVEWDRLAKAGLLYAGSKLGLPLPKEGGSTLATQLEKYRHSAAGRSHSLLDKFRQITGASLKVYREGSDTRGSRRQIVVDYLNTVPLAAAPGWGEVHGLGEGLYAWFGRKLDDVCAALRTPENSPEKIVAFKQVLALITAERAPSHYLIHNHSALETRVNAYTRLLAQEGILDAEFARRLRATTIVFSRPASIRLAPFSERKATNAIRIHLLELLGISDLYDLDRLDLKVNST